MKRFGWLLMLGAIAVVSNLSSPAQAQTPPETEVSEVIEIGTLTCRELLKSEGENRANLVIFMHGYISGKKGEMTINASTLAEATNNIVDACIDNPDQQLLSVFEEYR